ncbi:ABC transporter ATP-binding protein [Dongia soli]|uniref:ABC transporter ATP-binding protein n=1 Tax=Dongia soli TaxID=600628 RepID=A0ABU5EC97_9PROT|nr:ABC transporter ATP-binding protein [Dongia soli]MDY0883635.1 ABC transporter ATP-binding protein [Dongia soli]
MSDAPLLEVSNLSVGLGTPGASLEVVHQASFTVADGKTLGLVGESGCGKSITMLALMGLLGPEMTVSGSIKLRGVELIGMSQRELSRLRGNRIAMIFQDPMTSLNPVMTIGQQLGEAIAIHHHGLSRRTRAERAMELLKLVAIPFPERRLLQYPHELSGGMRQRVMIAIAMANDPELLIADEPTTALDVTIQAQIMELLQRLRAERNMGLVLISHDLGVVAEIADEVAIMYAGRICEKGTVPAVFDRPHHPYTHGLLASLPKIDRVEDKLTVIPGSLPPLASRPKGCRFHPRCHYAQGICATEEPSLRPVDDVAVACHFAETVLTATATGHEETSE